MLPFLKADKSIDKDELWPKGASRKCEFREGLWAYIAIRQLTFADSAEAVHGAPISIQVIARTGHDEELLDAVSIISKVLT